jgi:hypothetical protein
MLMIFSLKGMMNLFIAWKLGFGYYIAIERALLKGVIKCAV